MLMHKNKTSRARRIFERDKYPFQIWNEAVRRFILLPKGLYFEHISLASKLSNLITKQQYREFSEVLFTKNKQNNGCEIP